MLGRQSDTHSQLPTASPVANRASVFNSTSIFPGTLGTLYEDPIAYCPFNDDQLNSAVACPFFVVSVATELLTYSTRSCEELLFQRTYMLQRTPI